METLLFTLFLGTPLWLWFTFLGLVLAILVFDLGVLNKEDHEIGIAESLRLSAFYIALGLGFGGFVWYQLGATSAAEYFTAFV
ncbi:MAG: TerC family protein, partial [Gemmobacter sp.]